jgi:hypothetical protein
MHTPPPHSVSFLMSSATGNRFIAAITSTMSAAAASVRRGTSTIRKNRAIIV